MLYRNASLKDSVRTMLNTRAAALKRLPAVAAWKRKGGLGQYDARIIDGIAARGYDKSFAESICKQLKGFSEYGFPESHAASFALLVYASCWIKCADLSRWLGRLGVTSREFR